MKSKSSILLISLLALSGLMVMATTPTTSAQATETIFIGVVDGTNAYNETSIELLPDTTYNIVFVQSDPLNNHNLRIDVDGDIASGGDVADSDDITIGDPNDQGGEDDTYSGMWTTPDANTTVTYYCGFSGHYAAGMEGQFVIGTGGSGGGGNSGAPGFGLIAGIASLLFIGLAIPRMRKN